MWQVNARSSANCGVLLSAVLSRARTTAYRKGERDANDGRKFDSPTNFVLVFSTPRRRVDETSRASRGTCYVLPRTNSPCLERAAGRESTHGVWRCTLGVSVSLAFNYHARMTVQPSMKRRRAPTRSIDSAFVFITIAREFEAESLEPSEFVRLDMPRLFPRSFDFFRSEERIRHGLSPFVLRPSRAPISTIRTRARKRHHRLYDIYIWPLYYVCTFKPR